MSEVLLNRVYKHYKGNIYKVIAFASHSETLERMIVYQSITNDDIWVRPYKMWNDIVDNNSTQRFTLLEE